MVYFNSYNWYISLISIWFILLLIYIIAIYYYSTRRLKSFYCEYSLEYSGEIRLYQRLRQRGEIIGGRNKISKAWQWMQRSSDGKPRERAQLEMVIFFSIFSPVMERKEKPWVPHSVSTHFSFSSIFSL